MYRDSTKSTSCLLVACVALMGFLLLPPVVANAMPHVEISAESGERLYDDYCVRCHGPDLVNPGGSSFDLRRFPPDQKERFLRSVTEGRNSMPAWDGTLSQAEIEALWMYVLSKQQK